MTRRTLAVLGLGVLAVASCTSDEAPQGGGRQLAEGAPAPEFALSGLDGRAVSLSSLKGKVVVLDFWATWCGPCVKSLPHFASLAAEQGTGEVVFYAVNVQEPASKVTAFLEARRLQIPVLLDPTAEAARAYNVDSIPRTIIIGRDGTVRRIFMGLPPQHFTLLRQAVQEAQGE